MTESTTVTKHFFVDEAGDLTLFDKRGRIIVGEPGVSHCFFVGMLDLPNPEAASDRLEELRASLLSDPYFKGVPSMSPGAGKTASAFHAKDDLPEVRRAVMQLLPSLNGKVVIAFRRKAVLAMDARNQFTLHRTKWSPDRVYDDLVDVVFRGRLHKADAHRVVFARRGKSERNEALTHALDRSRERFLRRWGKPVMNGDVSIQSTVPSRSTGLQIVDYYLWALQRMVERREDRFFEALASQYRLIMDLDDRSEKPYGRWFNDRIPISLETMKPVTPS